jgi:hypothetical protein
MSVFGPGKRPMNTTRYFIFRRITCDVERNALSDIVETTEG